MPYAFVMVFATMVMSTAVIAIKASETPPNILAAGRMTVAVLVLLPFFLRQRRRHLWGWSQMRTALIPGLFLGIHFVSWNIGARLTIASNATLLVNLVPVVLPYLLWMILRERLSSREIIGTLLAVSGVGVLVVSDFRFNREYFWGDLVCLGSMVAYAAYLVHGRRNREIPHLLLYLWPVYAIAGLTCLAGAVLLEADALTGPFPLEELGLFLYLGLVPTIVGHSLVNLCLKHLRGQQVGLLNQGQFLWATGLAYLLLGEVPTPALIPAAVLLVVGATIALTRPPVPLAEKPFSAVESRPAVDTDRPSRDR